MTFLCVGAGAESEYFINKALLKGHKIIAVDGDKNAKCMQRKDIISYHVDLKDKDEVLKIAQKHNINAILPTPLGSIITTSGYINSKLGLKGVSYVACLSFTDKVKVNQIQKQNNLNHPKQYKTNEIYKINFPCIIKPKNGSGSKGVKVVYDKSELLNLDDDMIIEELIDGDEYSVNAILKNGKIYPICIFAKELTPYPYRQEIGYFSSSLTATQTNEIYKYTLNNAKALGIDNSLLNCDLILDKNKKPYIIDISARPGGNYVYRILEMLDNSAIDMYFDMILEDKDFKESKLDKQVYACFFDMVGKIIAIPNKQNFKDLMIINNLKIGDILSQTTCGGDLLSRGCVIAVGDDVYKLKRKCEKYIKEIGIEKI